jgi:hypothetical protein
MGWEGKFRGSGRWTAIQHLLQHLDMDNRSNAKKARLVAGLSHFRF